MNKIVSIIHLLFFIMLFIFGNSFLKFKIGISNAFLLIIFLVSIIHILLYMKGKKKIYINKSEKILAQFILLIIIYILFSILGLNKIFDINNFYFDNHYIFKQTMFLNLIPIGISLYICFINEYNFIKKLFYKYSKLIFFIFVILVNFKICNSTGTFFFILLLSFLQIKNKKNPFVLKILIIFLTLYYLKFIFSESTAILMLIFYFVILLSNKKTLLFIQKERKILYFIVIMIISIVLIKRNFFLDYLQKTDKNYWWRFTYWINELKILIKTYFLGIGYGTTYASTDIFDKLTGGFINPETGESVNNSKALFVTAQHNSYINILYRLGIIGLIVFLRLVISLFNNLNNKINNNFDKMILLSFINANIIIMFNVGLESPQFLLLFYFGLFGLMSLEKNKNLERGSLNE